MGNECLMNYWFQFMPVSEDERHRESDESDEWKKQRTGEWKTPQLQSFLPIRSIRQIRGAFTLSILKRPQSDLPDRSRCRVETHLAAQSGDGMLEE